LAASIFRGVSIWFQKRLCRLLCGQKVERCLNDFYSLWREAVESGLFDVMAHPDYFRRAISQMGIPLPTFMNMGDKSNRSY